MEMIEGNLFYVRKGEKLFVKPNVPKERFFPENVGDFAEIKVEANEGNEISLKFEKATILVVDEMVSRPDFTCLRVRFVRETRNSGKVVRYRKVMIWPRLRVALTEMETPTVHFLGGLGDKIKGLGDIPLYPDEIAVCDFSSKGSHFWIVKRKEIFSLLSLVPFSKKKIQGLKTKVMNF